MFIVFCLVMMIAWFMILVMAAKESMKQKDDHLKERARKPVMMKEYPELARDIFQSIEEQDVRWETQQAAKTKAVTDRLDKLGEGIKRATTHKPKSNNGAKFTGSLLKTGIALAAKRANNHPK